MDKNEELQKWLNDDRYVRVEDIMALHGLSRDCVWSRLSRGKIKPEKKIFFGPKGTYFFYNKKQCDILMTAADIKRADAQKMKANSKYVRAQQLETLWGVSRHSVVRYLKCYNIQPKKEMNLGAQLGTYVFYDRAECERARPFINQPEKEVEKVENIGELATATKHQILCETASDDFVWDKVTMKHKIMPVKNYCDERGNFVSLFKKDETVSAILTYKNEQKQLLEKCLADKNLVTTKDLETIWNCKKSNVYSKIYKLEIKPHVKVKLENGYIWHFYKKSDCIESQEVEKVEQVNLLEPKEQMPDIIPADTIDLFTMSELESELKNRGVQLTAEVKAKINASDMPEMQEIATMIRGNSKTIAIRLSVLNEIAGQLREIECDSKNESPDKIGKPRVLWLNMQERIVFEFLRGKSTYTSRSDIVEHIKAMRRPIDDLSAKRMVGAAISVLHDMGCLDANDGCFMINSNYVSTETMSKDVAANRKTDPLAIDIGLDNGKPINDKIKGSGWWTVGIISEISGKSESWLRSHLPIEDCLIEYGNNKLIKVWRPKSIIKWLNDRNIFVRGWGDMIKRPKNAMRKYNPEFDKIAFDMASQNKSDIEISNQLDVRLETFNKYKKEMPSFANAINSGMSAYLSSITSSQPNEKNQENKGISINQDLKDKLRFMAMADNVDLIKKLESIIMAAWVMGNYDNK